MVEDESKYKTIIIKEGLNQKELLVDAALLDKFLVNTSAKPGHPKSDDRVEREVSAFHAALENGGNMQKAMLDAGYPKHMVTPQSAYNLARSSSFKEMLSYYFPQNMLMEHEASLLNSNNPKWKDKSLDRIHKLLGNFQIKVELSAKGDEMKKLTDAELYAMAHGTADMVEGEFEDVSKPNTNEPSATS